MSVEKVEKWGNSTIFHISNSNPYFPPNSYEVVLPHKPDKFSSLPSLPTTPPASNVTKVKRKDYYVPGWGFGVTFLINYWDGNGSNTTEGPFITPKKTLKFRNMIGTHVILTLWSRFIWRMIQKKDWKF